MKKIKAPFNEVQCGAINRWQTSDYVHAFTCPNDGSTLIAFSHGMGCPNCAYDQDWVHDFMADPKTTERLKAAMEDVFGKEPQTGVKTPS